MARFNGNDTFLNFYIPDVSTAGQIFVPVPEGCGGDVIEIKTALNAAITVADATITPKIAGTAMTNGAITIAFTGSAAGDVDSSNPTSNNTVAPGDAIEIETDGGSTTTAAVFGTIVIRR